MTLSECIVRCRRPAMASWFEVWLSGADQEHLASVGEAMLDEVSRIERLLSRFDPAAEVARVNREAAVRPVRVDRELFSILEQCLEYWRRTEGYFDITAASRGRALQGRCPVPIPERVLLDPSVRTIFFNDPEITLDLGGYGKGYALDAAASLLDRYGVKAALMHGGTSSVRAIGTRGEGRPWQVGIRDPFQEEVIELVGLPLVDASLSSSAGVVRHNDDPDTVNPWTERPVSEPAACTVISRSAAEAEVLSTALLAMGRSKAQDYLRRNQSAEWLDCQAVCWIEREQQEAQVVWLQGARHEG